MLLYADNDGDATTAVSATTLSHLTSVSECVGANCLAPVRFEYTASEIDQGNYSNIHNGIFTRFKYMRNFKYIDINGDGRNEMIFLTAEDPSFWGGGDYRYRFNLAIRNDDLNWQCPQSFCGFQNSGFYKFAFDQSFGPIPNSGSLVDYKASNWHVIDYNGDGYQDLFARSSTSSHWTVYLSNGYKLCKDASNTGNSYANCSAYAPIDTGITTMQASHESALLDFNGDGLADLIAANGSSTASFKYHKASLVNGQINLDTNDTQVYIEKDNLDGTIQDPNCFPGSVNPAWPGCATNIATLDILKLHHLASDFNGDGYNDAFMRYSLTGFSPGCENGGNANAEDHPYYAIKSEEQTVISAQGDCPVEYYWSAMTFDPNYYKDPNYSHNNQPHFIPYSTVDANASFPSMLKDIQIIDINGDGLSDVAYRKGKQWHYKLNDGKAFGLEQSMHIEISVDIDDLKDNSFFVDYDYDGDIDILYPLPQVGNEIRFKLRTFEYYDANDATTNGCAAYQTTALCDNDENTSLLARTTTA